MLEYLHISNLALIEDMALEFDKGINVLTGETGAGKSFILKALGFLLGDKLTQDMVRPGAERALVEASFLIADADGEKELALRRELMASSGRSRFFVNDKLSSQEMLRNLRASLLSHTSQHAQQDLLQPQYQAALLEKELDAPELLGKRGEILEKLKNIAAEIKKLEARQATLADKRELLEMQKAEIDKVNPSRGEEEKLEAQRTAARSNVAARQNYSKAMEILQGGEEGGLLQLLQAFERIVRAMGAQEPSLMAEAENIVSFRQQMQHLGNTLPRPQAAARVDMNAIEERLFAFAQLKRKLKRSMPEILALKEEIQTNLSFLDICALDLARLAKERDRLASELREIVAAIKPLRHAAAEQMARRMESELRDLGFSEHVSVIPQFVEQEIWPGVFDERGRISWAPNPGQKPQPLDKIASGGELSRFLLAMNAIDARDANITFIFDEVDAGVGGLTLNKLADKLEKLGERHQIILITHWPRLAARAGRHFNIVKEVRGGQTFTQCAPLDAAGRKAELARMAGGGKEGDALAANLLEG